METKRFFPFVEMRRRRYGERVQAITTTGKGKPVQTTEEHMKNSKRRAAANPQPLAELGRKPAERGENYRQPTESRRRQIQKEIAAIRADLGLKRDAAADNRLARYEAQIEAGV